MTIAGQTFTVNQAGFACTYALGNASVTQVASGYLLAFPVVSQTGCTWTATSSASWLSIAGGATGSGTGTASYNVPPNTTNATRTATVTVAGITITITQR